jgi:hypothetical protein
MRSPISILALTAATLAGCEVQVNPPATAPSAPAAATTGGGQPMQQGGGSSLGKAKQSAQRIEDQVDLHNRRIEEAAEGINDP